MYDENLNFKFLNNFSEKKTTISKKPKNENFVTYFSIKLQVKIKINYKII